MKRRRWCLIALSLALLAACVVGWKWSERPPYRFMEGAKLAFAELDSSRGATDLVATFAIYSPPHDVDNAAAKELTKRGWHQYPPALFIWPSSRSGWASFYEKGDEAVTIEGLDSLHMTARVSSDTIFHPHFKRAAVPSGATGFVTVTRRPDVFDRVRAWLYGLRYNAPP